MAASRTGGRGSGAYRGSNAGTPRGAGPASPFGSARSFRRAGLGGPVTAARVPVVPNAVHHTTRQRPHSMPPHGFARSAAAAHSSAGVRAGAASTPQPTTNSDKVGDLAGGALVPGTDRGGQPNEDRSTTWVVEMTRGQFLLVMGLVLGALGGAFGIGMQVGRKAALDEALARPVAVLDSAIPGSGSDGGGFGADEDAASGGADRTAGMRSARDNSGTAAATGTGSAASRPSGSKSDTPRDSLALLDEADRVRQTALSFYEGLAGGAQPARLRDPARGQKPKAEPASEAGLPSQARSRFQARSHAQAASSADTSLASPAPPKPEVTPELQDGKAVRAALASGPAEQGEYTVQVSAFQTKPEAKAYAAALRRKGYRPFVVSSEVTGKGTWHRVRLGRFTKPEEAKQAKELLAKADIAGWVLKTQ